MGGDEPTEKKKEFKFIKKEVKNAEVMKIEIDRFKLGTINVALSTFDENGNVVVLKDEEFESDRAAEELGINLSRNEQLSAETDFTTYQ